jgi:hypothetical protein
VWRGYAPSYIEIPRSVVMMNMEGMGWMMTAGIGQIGILVIVLLVLGIAALAKYLFSESRKN